MSDVLRWGVSMARDPIGHFVTYHDYAMLQEECERLRAALAARAPSCCNGSGVILDAGGKAHPCGNCAQGAREEDGGNEPVAWLYTFTIPGEYEDSVNEVYRKHRQASADAPFGMRGHDFGSNAVTTETPLYAAPSVGAQKVAVPDELKLALVAANAGRAVAVPDCPHTHSTPIRPVEGGMLRICHDCDRQFTASQAVAVPDGMTAVYEQMEGWLESIRAGNIGGVEAGIRAMLAAAKEGKP